MKTLICLIMICALMGTRGQAAPAPAEESSPQLTVELRDGSRVVGQSVEDTLGFHSATLGNTQLPWAGIKAVKYDADTGNAHLTATNGDEFSVQLSIDTLHLQTEFGKTDLPLKLIRSIDVSPADKQSGAASGGVNETGPVLTIELRDGSHVVGKGLDDSLSFHSAAMGDLKLTWSNIRSIAYATADAESAQLTATNGDVYEVQFVAPTVRVETSFGKKALPVKLIRSITVSKGGAAGENLLGWWKLDEGSGTVAKDSSSSQPPHDGTLINGPAWIQTPGKSEWSLQFNGGNQYVSLGNIFQASYTQISIACWIRHSGVGSQDIVERGSWGQLDGIALSVNNNVEFGHYDSKVFSKAQVLDGQWHHLVGTMAPGENGNGYVYSIYVDGKLDNMVNNPVGLAATSSGWSVGSRYDGTWAYRGLVQDVRIYDRALSAFEVEDIYNQQDHGDASPTVFSPSFRPTEDAFSVR